MEQGSIGFIVLAAAKLTYPLSYFELRSKMHLPEVDQHFLASRYKHMRFAASARSYGALTATSVPGTGLRHMQPSLGQEG